MWVGRGSAAFGSTWYSDYMTNSPLHIGFTGTREGMSPKQFDALAEILSGIRALHQRGDLLPVLHFGDCKGADSEAHDLAAELGFWTIAHPPTNPKHRAFCAADEILPELPYLERDRAIVEVCDRLIAAPLTRDEHPRSGTWYTIRHAYSLGRPATILERG
jgi:hypothetical protein